MITSAKIIQTDSDPVKYHAQFYERGTKDFVVSSSMLRKFADCPARWLAGLPDEKTDAKDFGSLLDTRLLQPHLFDKRYAIKPKTYRDEKTGEEKKWNGNSNVCKRWLEDNKDFEPVSAEDVADVDAAIERLAKDETAKRIILDAHKSVEIRGEWKDKATGLTIPLKALLDIVPHVGREHGRTLFDLKCIRSGNHRLFQRQIYQMGWHLQLAIYLDLYVAATGEDRCEAGFIAIENFSPFEPVRRMLSNAYLDLGRAQYKLALARYATCLKSGYWPGYDEPEQFTIVSPEDWMLTQAMPEFYEAKTAEPYDYAAATGDTMP